MRLASLYNNTRDGQLVVVNSTHTKAIAVPDISKTMQEALDNWKDIAPKLKMIYDNFSNYDETIDLKTAKFLPPLPRAFHWADGSAYVTHVELVRKARAASLPESFWTDPLIYMGASDAFLGAYDPIPIENEKWGIDFESEIAVITDDVPAGIKAKNVEKHIKLLTFVNDVSLRNLIPNELSKQFGFYQSKTWTSFAPIALTPDELGDKWTDGKLNMRIKSVLNGKTIGTPDAGIDMTFSFYQLVSHAAKTRPLMAGTIIGSGTVANQGSVNGASCLAEVRALEMIKNGEATTPFMQFGDRIEIQVINDSNESVFGKIDQIIKEYKP